MPEKIAEAMPGEQMHLSTNAIDADIAAITDPAVQRRLAAAFERLRGQTEYGLVFERHVPESVVLHGQAVKGDRYATLRSHPGAQDAYRVKEIDGELALVQPVDENFRPAGEAISLPLEELVPLARFGDPIFPGLTQTGEVLRAVDKDGQPTKPFHTVINGENFHALETLLYAYENQVDCIYIDPPYNSGAKDWKYNNDYVDRDDRYRHSLWLSFMEKRLLLAQRLLNPKDSVLVVTIDEKEYLRLGLLLEQIFKGCDVVMVTSVISAKGAARAGRFSRVEEHIFYVFIGDAKIRHGDSNMLPAYAAEESDDDTGDSGVDEVVDGVDAIEEKEVPQDIEWLGLRRREPSSVRGARPNQFYPIFVHATSGLLHSVGDAVDDDVDRHSVNVPDGTVALWPLKPNGTEMLWGLTPEVLRANWSKGYARVNRWNAAKRTGTVQYLTTGTIAKIEDGRIVVTGRGAGGYVEGHSSAAVAKSVRPKRVWHMKSHNAEAGGTTILSRLLPGRRFDYAKSLYAVEDALRFVVGDKPEALIMDFFSGSGTTAHAVMRLNRQDTGMRRAVLVTNNEVSSREQDSLREKGYYPGDTEWEALGICEYITTPRLTAAVTGLTPAGDPVKGEYKIAGARIRDSFPMRDGFEENVRFFTLEYLDPEVVEAKKAFAQIAPLLWLAAGAEGPVIDFEPAAGWALPEGARYGVLFRNKGRADFAKALAERVRDSRPVRKLFVVADSADEFHRSVREIGADPGITTRLYRHYLKNFRTNVFDMKESLL
ncbi:site-specific DNA-methyltransferase [Microbacterium oxydans]|uniref:site-specific DNA-methyltransferase n=1 Tax=Microbacterium oxydans TaxID=82380 RepID=UPI0024ACD2F5|nr:DNA methyltransferase [Microbacterium oxydans]